MSGNETLKRTPLFDTHQQLGGRMVEFAGYSMPVQYTSILDEHAAVRERAGLFDVSHMGQIHLLGRDAITCAERLVSRRVDSMAVGRAGYGLLCNEAGGVVDDVMVHRMADDHVMFCVNAANVDKDRVWIEQHAEGDLQIDDRSESTGLLALQGPVSAAVLGQIASPELRAIGRFRFAMLDVAGTRAMVANTGYTGAPGFEIYLDAESTEAVFEKLLDVGSEQGVVPVGLGARDTLRLEAALALYGHELDDETSPLEAGLGQFVKRKRGGFIGASAIEQRAAAGHPRSLVGFELTDRGIARADHAVTRDGEAVGVVTSGGPSPTLGRSIGLAYVPPEMSEPGTPLTIAVRNRELAAVVVPTPFVRPEPSGSSSAQV